jgi:uncharacterized protein YgiM (DUF1202 family)
VIPIPSTAQTNAPAAAKAAPKKTTKAAAKPAAKKAEPKPVVKSEPVLSPEPGVSRQNNVNVRGQASINSEVITSLRKNQPVTILEEVILKKAKQDEPSRWFRIALPTNVTVWVHNSYIEATTKTVKARRLNLRGGPGENYSVVGRLEQGATVNQIDSKGDWLKIETPTNASGFVAAHLLERRPATIAAVPPVRPAEVVPVPPTVTTAIPPSVPPVIAEVTPVTPAVVPGAPLTPTATIPPVTPPPVTNPPPAEIVPPVEVEPLPDTPIEKVKKIVSREGILKGSLSIQAPSYFELRSLDTGKTINYVFSPSTNLLLKEFKGKRIIVTGEELLDERWQNTPVITVDSLQTVP